MEERTTAITLYVLFNVILAVQSRSPQKETCPNNPVTTHMSCLELQADVSDSIASCVAFSDGIEWGGMKQISICERACLTTQALAFPEY